MILLQAQGSPGIPIFNEHMIELTNYLGKFVAKNLTMFQSTALALGSIFVLIVAAGMAYKMMTLNGKLDILQLLRPLLIALVLSNWPKFVPIVTAPGEAIETEFSRIYTGELQTVIDLREQRMAAANSVGEKLREKQAAAREAERAMNESEGALDKIWNIAENAFEMMTATLKGWLAVAETYFLNLIEKIIVWAAELIWQISVYFIFLLKAIYLAALSIFGPISIACSVLPTWKDAWSTWLGRTISVSFYGAMAYLVMIFSLQLVKYGLSTDISVLNQIAANEAGIIDYMASNFGTTMQTVIGLLCGAVAMKSVPEIASWIVPSSIAQSAQSFYQGTAGRINGKIGIKQ
jgi:hypothetical protein